MKTNSYVELKRKHEKEVNDFKGLFFAFSDKQLKEGMESVGLTINDLNKIYSIGAGGYILKERSKDFKDMFDRHNEERKELKKQEKLLIEALVYELKNHEFCITLDPQDALDSLDIERKEIDPKILKKAIALCMEEQVA